MNLHRSRLAVLAFAVGIAALGAGCGADTASTGSGGPKTVRLGSFSRAVDYGPYLVAKQKGWFDEALRPLSAKASFTEFDSAPAINEALATGRVDVVFEAAPPALVAKAAGIGVEVPAISASVRQEVLVRSGSGINDLRALKGKRIAVLTGTSSQYGLLKDLESAGLGKKDVQIVDAAPPDAKAAFEAGKVDAWAVWPPFIQQEELAGKGTVLPRGTHQIQSLMVSRTTFSDQEPQMLAAVVATVNRAKSWIGTHPAQAQAILAEQLGVPVAVVKRAWPVHDFGVTIDAALIRDVQAKADFLTEQGFLKKKVDVTAFLKAGGS